MNLLTSLLYLKNTLIYKLPQLILNALSRPVSLKYFFEHAALSWSTESLQLVWHQQLNHHIVDHIN